MTNSTIEISIEELYVLSTALTAALIEYSMTGRWIDATQTPEVQGRAAHQAKKLLEKVDKSIDKLIVKNPSLIKELLRYASKVSYRSNSTKMSINQLEILYHEEAI